MRDNANNKLVLMLEHNANDDKSTVAFTGESVPE